MPLGIGCPCQIPTLFIFLISPTDFVPINLTLLHGNLRLACPTFNSFTPIIRRLNNCLYYLQNQKKTLTNNLITNYYEQNIGRIRYKISTLSPNTYNIQWLNQGNSKLTLDAWFLFAVARISLMRFGVLLYL